MANAVWQTAVAAVTLPGGCRGLAHRAKHPQDPAHWPSLPPCPLCSIPHSGTAHGTHLAARSEQAKEVPACSKEGETEAHSLSSQRDSARDPLVPPAPETSPDKWKHPTAPGWEHHDFCSCGQMPFVSLVLGHQTWHHSQAWASRGEPAPAPAALSCHQPQHTARSPLPPSLPTALSTKA